MTRPMASPWRCTAIVAAALSLCWLPDIRAQAQELPPPPQGVSRGENFSAKPPAQLFASDCTGAGCHKGPQGLGRKSVGIGGLQGFLREHYTNSRESAAALANYLSKLPSGPEPKEPREARSPKPGKPAAAAAAPASGSSNWFESTSTEGKPGSPEPRKPREAAHTPPGRGPHTASKPEPGAKPEGSAKPEEPPTEVAHQHPAAEPEAEKPEPAAKPAEPPGRNARGGRGRHPVAAANAPAAAPAAAAEPEPAPPAPPPAAPKPKQYDIFD